MILLRLRRRIAKFHVGLDRHEFSSIDRRPSPAWPEIDLLAVDDPVSRILSASEFPKVVQFFADSPSARRSLVSPDTQALLYCLGRNLQGDAIEIGVFKAATTEALARSMNDNIVHAVDPYAYPYVREMLLAWPTEIAKKVVLHPVDSLTFFIDRGRLRLSPSLVFVDGNHDYEFAYFDICRAAKVLRARGFIVIDNVAQPGPFMAAQDFLKNNPGWTECGGNASFNGFAYDKHRTAIKNTDAMIIRAPSATMLTSRPFSFGEQLRSANTPPAAMRIIFETVPTDGILSAQVIVRGFGKSLTENIYEGTISLTRGQSGEVDVPLSGDFNDLSANYFKEEVLMTWRSLKPLVLVAPPITD